MSRNLLDNFSKNSSSKQRNTLTVILSIFSLAIVLFSFWQIRDAIYSPFNFEDEYEKLASAENIPEGTCKGANCIDEEKLKNQDTDNDGLSDFEELNFYMTSPYLEDTDSDGISDKVEIESGSNPNCGPGQNCNQLDVVASSNDNDLQRALEKLQVENESEIYPEIKPVDSTIINDDSIEGILQGNISPDDLRSILREAGIEEEMVQSFSDEELLNLYNETLSEQSF